MKIEDEILINKYGQGLPVMEQLIKSFNLFDLLSKRLFLNDILYLIMQSKPKDDDIESAIEQSKLKPTYTPCILLRKGVANHHLQKIANLPENELDKVFILFLSLFKIAYTRRFQEEKSNSGKWWYMDLSDDKTVDDILNRL